MTSDTLPAETVAAGPTALRPSPAGLALLTWPVLDASGADAAVTARSGGVSSGPYATLNLSLSVGDDPGCVLENRRRLAAGFGASPEDFVFARQVHGAAVRVVGVADRGSGASCLDDAVADADALVTTSPGVVLAILTADCVPIVLHDPVAAVLACVHAGWRGTVAGVTTAALAAMQAFGSRPSDVIAGIGPAIAAARYQVGADVHQAVTQAFGPAAAAFIRPDANPDARPDVDPDAHPRTRAPTPPRTLPQRARTAGSSICGPPTAMPWSRLASPPPRSTRPLSPLAPPPPPPPPAPATSSATARPAPAAASPSSPASAPPARNQWM